MDCRTEWSCNRDNKYYILPYLQAALHSLDCAGILLSNICPLTNFSDHHAFCLVFWRQSLSFHSEEIISTNCCIYTDHTSRNQGNDCWVVLEIQWTHCDRDITWPLHGLLSQEIVREPWVPKYQHQLRCCAQHPLKEPYIPFPGRKQCEQMSWDSFEGRTVSHGVYTCKVPSIEKQVSFIWWALSPI